MLLLKYGFQKNKLLLMKYKTQQNILILMKYIIQKNKLILMKYKIQEINYFLKEHKNNRKINNYYHDKMSTISLDKLLNFFHWNFLFPFAG